MSRYDGLIIPRSYSEYINKTDAATLLQALQQSGVMDAAPTANSNHPVKSGGVAAYANKIIKIRISYIASITLLSEGYADVRSYKPANMNNFLFAILRDYGVVSTKDAIGIESNGNYIRGTAGAVCNNINIMYFYTD